MRIIIKKFAIQDENHNQEIQEYGHLPLLQFIQDDNQTFHPLKAIQDVGHYQEIRKYGPLPLLQCIQDDNPTFHPLQAIPNESHYQISEIRTFTLCSG